MRRRDGHGGLRPVDRVGRHPEGQDRWPEPIEEVPGRPAPTARRWCPPTARPGTRPGHPDRRLEPGVLTRRADDRVHAAERPVDNRTGWDASPDSRPRDAHSGSNPRGDAQEGIAWSPDGTRIAFVLGEDIYVIDADGSNMRQLTTAPGGDYQPAWSSQGRDRVLTRVELRRRRWASNSEIYTIPAAGGTPTRLTHDDMSSIAPAWSPDGTQIVHWEGGELSVMEADGSGALARDRGMVSGVVTRRIHHRLPRVLRVLRGPRLRAAPRGAAPRPRLGNRGEPRAYRSDRLERSLVVAGGNAPVPPLRLAPDAEKPGSRGTGTGLRPSRRAPTRGG